MSSATRLVLPSCANILLVLFTLLVVTYAQTDPLHVPPSSLTATASLQPATTAPPTTSLTIPRAPGQPKPSDARAPLLMLSTMDGTVSVFDAASGKAIFTYHDSKPAIQTWSAPGFPEYVPSLDGFLYRIDRETQEAHAVEGKFITRDHASNLANVLPALHPSASDAVVLTSEESSLLYIDMQAGRVLRETRFDDKQPPSPDPITSSRSDLIVVVQRTTVSVRILDTSSGRELANATYVHTDPRFWQQGRCVSPTNPAFDQYAAYATDNRDKVIVRNINTGNVLWSKDVSTPVVEAHGLGGVRIVSSLGEWMAIAGGASNRQLPANSGRAPNTDNYYMPRYANHFHASRPSSHVIIAENGRYLYASTLGANLVANVDAASGLPALGDKQNVPALPAKRNKYIIKNAKDVSLGQVDRIMNSPNLPRKLTATDFLQNDVVFQLTSAQAGISFLVIIMVGYLVGRRSRRYRYQRLQNVNDSDSQVAGSNATNDSLDDDDHDNLVHDERYTTILRRGQRILPGITHAALSLDAIQLVGSNGSTGSASGGDTSGDGSDGVHGIRGYLSKRSQSGWMTVGCLRVSSKVLGVGSHGTVVYEGKLMPGERKVAVKRLLRQFYESARKEISLLVELDEASPHVVRYFAMEEDSDFIYLALELCANSLADCITNRKAPVPTPDYRNGPPPDFTSHALRQLIQGLADLHRAGVVHRDVKPQNVLITRPATTAATASTTTTTTTNSAIAIKAKTPSVPPIEVGDIKLADVGLALRLGENRSSYTAVSNAAGGLGTTGWRAPEVLNGGRQTKAVDIFAAGCIVSSVLTGGDHPFGTAIFGRDGNIAQGRPSLDSLEALQLPEATDIVRKMIDPVAAQRPCAEDVLKHPFFWTDATKLAFLVDISDRLYDLRNNVVRYTENLDRYPASVRHLSDWIRLMDSDLMNNLGRGYENNASGLLRVIRNKKNHYSELPSYLRRTLGPLPEEDKSSMGNSAKNGHDATKLSTHGGNFLTYFTKKVPHLLMCVYEYALENPALISQPHFSRYGIKIDWSRSSDTFPSMNNAGDGSIAPERSKFIPPSPAPVSALPSFPSATAHSLANRANSRITLAPKSSLTSTLGVKGSRFSRIANDDDDDDDDDDGKDGDDEKGNGSGGENNDSNENRKLSDTGAEGSGGKNGGKKRRKRIEYHRHVLVAIQVLCPDPPLDVRRRMVMCDVYNPSAYDRYLKRLASNDFSADDAATGEAKGQQVQQQQLSDGQEQDMPPGFSRVGPRKGVHHFQNHGHGGMSRRQNNGTMMMGNATSSHFPSNNNGIGIMGEREIDFSDLGRKQ